MPPVISVRFGFGALITTCAVVASLELLHAEAPAPAWYPHFKDDAQSAFVTRVTALLFSARTEQNMSVLDPVIKSLVSYSCGRSTVPWDKYMSLPRGNEVATLSCSVAGFRQKAQHRWVWTYWQYDFESNQWREGMKHTWR